MIEIRVQRGNQNVCAQILWLSSVFRVHFGWCDLLMCGESKKTLFICNQISQSSVPKIVYLKRLNKMSIYPKKICHNDGNTVHPRNILLHAMDLFQLTSSLTFIIFGVDWPFRMKSVNGKDDSKFLESKDWS